MPQRLPQRLHAPLAVELGLLSAADLEHGAPADGASSGAAALAPAALRQLTVSYAHERLYLQRLRLVKLSMLYVAAAGRFEGQSLGSVQKVLAAWRQLRSEDVKAKAAVLEVIDSGLTPPLKSGAMWNMYMYVENRSPEAPADSPSTTAGPTRVGSSSGQPLASTSLGQA